MAFGTPSSSFVVRHLLSVAVTISKMDVYLLDVCGRES